MSQIIQGKKGERTDNVAILEQVALVEGVETVLLAVGEIVETSRGREVVPVAEIQGMAIPKAAIDDGTCNKQAMYECLMQDWLNFKYGMRPVRNERIIIPGGRA